MRRLAGWLLGGSDELGWDDLVRRTVEAIRKLAHHAERGRVAFPPDVTVRIETGPASVEVIRGFVDKPDFDQSVGAALANASDCPADVLPRRDYEVVASEGRTIVRAAPGVTRVWSLVVDGGDRSGRTLALPGGHKDARFGRGEWHGPDRHVPNDLVVCETTEFVSRRAGRISHVGHNLEVEALDQGDALVVRRENGEVIRPARTARGRVPIREGDVIELGDGGGNTLRLTVRRTVVGQDHGGDHG